ncbi:MAG: hypothetical protein SNJ70_07295 [Armatimonadota bacterium]
MEFTSKLFINTKIVSLLFILTIFCIILSTPAITNSGGLVFSRQGYIFYIKSGTTNSVKLASGDYPSISPDNTKVVFCKPTDLSSENVGELLIYDILTKKTTSIYKAKGDFFYPQWSSDGSLIAFKKVIDYTLTQLLTIKPDGSDIKKLIDSKSGNISDIYFPTWYGDSKSIYFHDIDFLYRIDLNGKILSKANLETLIGKKYSISSEDKFVVNPKNNNLILYSRYDTGSKKLEDAFMGQPNTSLYIYDTTTRKSKRLTDNTMFASSPAWSKDGKYIYFSGYKDTNASEMYPFRIFRMNANGTGLSYIAMGEYPHSN